MLYITLSTECSDTLVVFVHLVYVIEVNNSYFNRCVGVKCAAQRPSSSCYDDANLIIYYDSLFKFIHFFYAQWSFYSKRWFWESPRGSARMNNIRYKGRKIVRLISSSNRAVMTA